MMPEEIDKVFYFISISVYAISTVLYAISLVFGHKKAGKAGAVAAIAGLVVHSVSLWARWAESGHGPYMNTYEVLSSNVWMAVLFFLLIQVRFRWLGSMGVAVMGLSFLMMGASLLGSTEMKNIPPTLDSAWLGVHVFFAKLTVASMLVATATAIFCLVKEAGIWSDRAFLGRIPEPRALDEYSYRFVALGFIMLTVMIIAGSIWAHYSWGSYWSWDPTETWSLVVWFVYGLYLHGRVTFRWGRKPFAWFVIAAFVFSLIAFFLIPYFVKSQHNQYMIG